MERGDRESGGERTKRVRIILTRCSDLRLGLLVLLGIWIVLKGGLREGMLVVRF